ncbi:MAG: hypothetical protein IKL73_01965 [Lachnospiraceae bacterium]|nr:hypothetical protein [Lachnospiraceae bacterium]
MAFFLERNVVALVMLLIFIIGVFGLVTVYVEYKRMYDDLESNTNCKNRFVKHIVLKYESIVNLNMSIGNTEVFVNKHLKRCNKYGMSLEQMERLSRLTIILNTSIGVVNVLLGLVLDLNLKSVAVNLLVSTFLAMLFYFLEELFDIEYMYEKLVLLFEEKLDGIMINKKPQPLIVPADKETKKEIKQLKKLANEIDIRRENGKIVEEVINQYLS